MKRFLLTTLFLMNHALAVPEQLEVWFLSELKPEKTTFVFPSPFEFSRLMVEAEYKCIPMGDHCFDPQIGLYDKAQPGKMIDAAPSLVEEDTGGPPPASSLDRNMIDCKKEEHKFDIFCGKAKSKTSKPANVEMWIDVSSSLSRIDPLDKNHDCYRKSLVRRIHDSCKEGEVDFYVYNTNKKQLGDWDTLCTNVGLNTAKGLINWIKENESKKLIIITDVHELSKEFTDFVMSIGGNMRGENEREPLDAKTMLDVIPTIAKSCEKK
ncbi:MAG: hypothetical protein JNM93_01030 [Bacteriovoracaceae bacterium]|nr:hypothetical protein [Bacteriovoracaceae bacterium]